MKFWKYLIPSLSYLVKVRQTESWGIIHVRKKRKAKTKNKTIKMEG